MTLQSRGATFRVIVEHLLHFRADPDHLPPAVQGFQPGLELAVFAEQALVLQGPAGQVADFLQFQRLGHIVKGAFFDGRRWPRPWRPGR